MAIYHLRLKNISRRSGSSLSGKVAYNSANQATASIRRTVAYRTGGRVMDTETGKPISFAAKKGVTHTEILLPAGELPEWAHDRWALWDEVARIEKRVNSRYAKEFELNLPLEISPQQRLDLARGFLRSEVVDARGLPVDLALHRYGSRKRRLDKKTGEPVARTAELVAEWKGRGLPFLEEAEASRTEAPHVMIERNRQGRILGWRLHQPHAHGLMMMRPLSAEGFARHKDRWIDKAEALEHWRASWAEHVNRALAAAGSAARVDHRTLEAQRIARKPLPGTHVAADHIAVPTGRIARQIAQQHDTQALNRAIWEGMRVGLAVATGGVGAGAMMAVELLAGAVSPAAASAAAQGVRVAQQVLGYPAPGRGGGRAA